MSRPPFLEYFAEKIGKPLDAFTKQDWKDAATTAARFLEESVPKQGRPGRPRKRPLPGTLACLLAIQHPTTAQPPRGRPRQKYGRTFQLAVEQIATIVDDILSPAVRKKWPNEAPRTKAEAVRKVLRSIGHEVSYAKAVERALRRLKQ